MARVSLDPPRTLFYRLVTVFTRRRFGAVPDPMAAMAHNPRVARSYVMFELRVERWRALDRGLRDLATLAAAMTVGCSWCVDFGYWISVMQHDVPEEKIRAVATWRDSELFTEVERLVLEYAEAMSATPPVVTDELTRRLGEHLSSAQLIELTAIIGVENLRSRMNSALGLEAQGFKARCELAPARQAAEASGSPAPGAERPPGR